MLVIFLCGLKHFSLSTGKEFRDFHYFLSSSALPKEKNDSLVPWCSSSCLKSAFSLVGWMGMQTGTAERIKLHCISVQQEGPVHMHM